MATAERPLRKEVLKSRRDSLAAMRQTPGRRGLGLQLSFCAVLWAVLGGGGGGRCQLPRSGRGAPTPPPLPPSATGPAAPSPACVRPHPPPVPLRALAGLSARRGRRPLLRRSPTPVPEAGPDRIAACARALLAEGVRAVVVTLGAAGVLAALAPSAPECRPEALDEARYVAALPGVPAMPQPRVRREAGAVYIRLDAIPLEPPGLVNTLGAGVCGRGRGMGAGGGGATAGGGRGIRGGGGGTAVWTRDGDLNDVDGEGRWWSGGRDGACGVWPNRRCRLGAGRTAPSPSPPPARGRPPSPEM